MGRARYDQNNNVTLIGVSNADGETPVEIWVDPVTHKLLADVAVSATVDPPKQTDKYGIQAISDDGTYKYFFFEDDSANYYIMRKHKTNKTFSYTKGTGGYASVYVNSSSGPSGSPTWGDRGATF